MHLGFWAGIVFLLLLGTGQPAFGGNASLSWAPNPEADLAGYKLYYGTRSGAYGTPIILGRQTSYTLEGLSEATYYFALTAYDTSGNESRYSEEVHKAISGTGLDSSHNSRSAESSGGGCGMVLPKGGSASGPGDAAGMLTMIAILLLLLLRARLRSAREKWRFADDRSIFGTRF